MDVLYTASQYQRVASQWIERATDDCDTRAGFDALVIRQSSLCTASLRNLQAQLLGPQGMFCGFSMAVAQEGRQADALGDVPELEHRERIASAERVVEFVLGQHHRRATVQNPFNDKSREFLCCVVYDEMAPYALVERYAALEALRQQDSEFFAALIATTRGTVERRVVFHGLLEHFDALLPVERCIYPENYRKVHQRHLDQEELLYGKLELGMPVRQFLREFSLEYLLQYLKTVRKEVR
jgi:hypothetical protein